MKQLFKNSFFTFFKSKIAIILLIIIVFATSATFTMFTSATNAFSKSYNQVMREGNRHEYTIKELYSIDGDVVFEEPKQLPGSEGEFQNLEYSSPITSADEYLHFESEDYVVVSFDYEEIKFSGNLQSNTSGLVLIDKQSAIDGNLKLRIPFKVDTSTATAKFAFPMNKNEIKSASSTDKTFVASITIDSISILNEIEIFSAGLVKGVLKISNSYAETLVKIANNLDKSFNKEMVDYNKYAFGLDYSSSSLGTIYKELDAIKKYMYYIGVKKSDSNLSWDEIKNLSIYLFDHYTSKGKLTNFQDELKTIIYAEAKFNLHKNLLNKLSSYEEVIYKDVESIQVSSESNIYKFVKENESEINKIKIFEGSNLPGTLSEDILVQNLETRLQKLIDSVHWSTPNAELIKNLYKAILPSIRNPKERFNTGWSLYVTSSIKTIRAIDYSAFAAVVSPSYASKNNIKPIDIETYNSIVTNEIFLDAIEKDNSSFEDIKKAIETLLPKEYSSSLIYAGTSPYLAVGIGITPDFAFPIISPENPIPNNSNQAIMYANSAGYSRIKEANSSSQTENYVAFGFKKGVKQSVKNKIVYEISEFANNTTSWPDNINAVERFDSEDENVILVPKRVTFLDKLNNTVSTVSYVVTSLLTIFAAFIVSLVIKKQIDSRKKQLGILLANGFSKLQIASSMMVIGLIIATIPTISGYIIGHFMQLVIMNIFNNYWTIPLHKTQFDLLSLILTLIIPLIGISLLAFVVSLFALRGRIPEILVGETMKNGLITKQLMKPVELLKIKTKMGTSIMFANVGKIFIALLAFIASITSMTISINSIDKFEIASKKSLNATDYDYQIDLITPTVEAGLYSSQTLDSIFYNPQTGAKITEISTEGILDSMLYPTTNWGEIKEDNLIEHYDDAIILHTPNAFDAYFAAPTFVAPNNYYPYYLKNRIQLKSLLNFDISAGIIPWQIASQMMPENQKNTADLVEAEFIDYVAQKYKDETDSKYVKYWTDLIDPTKGILKLENDKYVITPKLENLTYTSNGSSTINDPDRGQHVSGSIYLKQHYLHFIAYGLALTTNEYLSGNKDVKLPYYMSYNNILMDVNDEQYTYIDINLTKRNVQGSEKTTPIKIKGLDEQKLEDKNSMIKLSSKTTNKLLSYKDKIDTLNYTPIVINKYMQEYYNMNVGDTFNSEINNMTNRYLTEEKPNGTFKVIAIEETYNSGKIYTLQSIANKLIGLDALIKEDELAKKPFNGVMTNEESPLIFKTLSLYSPSSIYPGKNNIQLSNTYEDGYITINRAFFENGSKYTFPNPLVTNMKELMKVYGADTSISPMLAVYTSIDWAKVSDYQFNSIMELSSTLMNVVQWITLFIALSFVLLISTMIISDNTKFIATLKVLGYKDKEISRVFLMTFIPAILLSILIATPVTIGLIAAIRVAIMGFGSVLIPLYIKGWEIIISTALLIIGFLIMYAFSLKGMKNTSLLQAFSE